MKTYRRPGPTLVRHRVTRTVRADVAKDAFLRTRRLATAAFRLHRSNRRLLQFVVRDRCVSV
ncbi:hypothetical protein C493_14788 [Natronolimnohabitans innermongolicus JCM 12255]|uniref:Uncharacterized protein n=1 Tax=Natronolimnohabitans innermongolicus JCM 12255 TaxID=1227499 RepID=L9WVT0_9EURY|nr:hypothetical protein C493_14788 [Natronolimnohabitans innermongolicus JCM 12255]